MYRTHSVLIAEMVLIDKTTNNASVINLLDEVRSSGYPLIIPRFTVLALNSREEGDPSKATADLAFLIGASRSLHVQEVEIDFKDSPRNRSLVRVEGLPVPEPGDLKVTFRIRGTRAATSSMPVRASLLEQQAPAPETTVEEQT